MSTLNTMSCFNRFLSEGCTLSVLHLDIVFSAFPSMSENHFFVLWFSTLHVFLYLY